MKPSIICYVLAALVSGTFDSGMGPVRSSSGQLNVGECLDSYLDQEVAVLHLEGDVFHCISVLYQVPADF